MKYIAIVGKPYTNLIQHIADYQSDITLVAFQDTQENHRYPDHVKEVFKLDFTNNETVQAGLEQLKPMQVDGVISCYEAAIPAMVRIGDYFGCNVPTEEAIAAATDKRLMRQKFMSYDPSITPAFTQVKNHDDITAFLHNHQLPLVLKPANLMKSLLVTVNRSEQELRDNFDHADQVIAQTYQQYGVFHQQPAFVLEEYLDGTSHSIDLIATNDGTVIAMPVVDYITAAQHGVNDNYTYARILPSSLSKEDQAAVAHCATQGVKALGLTNSFAHAEIILTAQGPKVVEIGARAGGYRPRMYEMSCGLKVHDAMIQLALGEPINLHQTTNHGVIVYEFFPEREGRLVEIVNLEKIKQLPSFYSFSQPKKPGDMAGLSSQGYKFCASLFLFNQDPEQLRRDADFINEQVAVITE